ncbi:MAG: Gfo/Idh/MocA family oxidoreductase [Tepidisphaeraceae bacterium]|jgi:predicted dehydrogenase
MNIAQLSRRSVLRTAAAVAAPIIVPSSVFGATAPSNRVNVASIGVGGQGSGLLNAAAGHPLTQYVGICDCFKSRRENHANRLNQRYGSNVVKTYGDLREMLARTDIDAVIIATGDHWHVPAGLMAVRSGKDVYIEKPLGLSIEQDIAMRTAVHRYGRLFQYGTQQRSQAHIRFGCELVRNGRIGKIKAVHVVAPGGQKGGGSTKAIPVPDDLDYDMWLGPVPYSPYTSDRCTSGGSWFVSDNCLGFIGGWGAHPLDVMIWGLGDTPAAVPVEYEGTGEFGDGLFDCCASWNIKGKFADGKDFTFTTGGDLTTFVGETGKVHISRGGLRTEPESLMRDRIGPSDIHLYESSHHQGNFIECVRNRKPTIVGVDEAVLSDTVTQISLIAILTGRKIKWDNQKEAIIDDPAASQLLTRAMRTPWHL